MTDDIVTRLRDAWNLYGIVTAPPKMALEAADEIERLRNQVRQLETERDQWQRMAVNDK